MTTTSAEAGGHAPTARTPTIAAPSTAGLIAYGSVLKGGYNEHENNSIRSRDSGAVRRAGLGWIRQES